MSYELSPVIASVGPTDPFWYEPVSRRTAAGINVNEAKSMTYSAVWAAVRVLCGTGGSIPLHLFESVDLSARGLRGEGSQKATGHPVDRLLRWKFNEEMTAGDGRRLMWQWQVNFGNADAEIIRNRFTGELVGLIPLEPWFTECKRSERTGELVWHYRPDVGEPRELPRDKVFHVPNIITRDGVIGLGAIQAARESIGMGLATEQFGARFFGGDGIPRIVIEYQGSQLTPEMRREFHNEWSSLYGGPGGRKVAILGGGTKATPLQLNAEDSQFLETREFNVEEIARWYGIPPHMLQRMVQVTYNNAEILPIDFVKFTLLQYLDVWESAINTQLLTAEEADTMFAKHNVNGLLRGDSKSRMEFYKGMTGGALMTRNEARSLEDLPPVEGGDTFLVQGATVPLDEEGKPESDFTGNAGPPDTGNRSTTTAIKRIAEATRRAIEGDLKRMASREAKVAMDATKHAGEFVSKVDAFYENHATFLTATLLPHFEVLSECGMHQSAPEFVEAWCAAGKESILAAAGTSTVETLEPSVKAAVESSVWLDRPRAALSRLE